jgi:hypothetical protein
MFDLRKGIGERRDGDVVRTAILLSRQEHCRADLIR